MILDLGLIDYEKCYKIQKEMVARRKLCEIDDTLILAEHNSVFTIGRLGHRDNLLVDERYLRQRGVKLLNIDRGGDITFHGKGQLVLYSVIALKNKYRDLHMYMHNLEDVAIKFLGRYPVIADRCAGRTGVWVSGKKIASIGVGVSNWVTFHGLSININTDLEFFDMINPCGLKGVEMTSLSRLIGKDMPMDEVKAQILCDYETVFGSGCQYSIPDGAADLSADIAR